MFFSPLLRYKEIEGGKDAIAPRQLAHWQRNEAPDPGEKALNSTQASSREAALKYRPRQTARLLVAIERLPPDYREVLYLRNFEDLPYADVAALKQAFMPLDRSGEVFSWDPV